MKWCEQQEWSAGHLGGESNQHATGSSYDPIWPQTNWSWGQGKRDGWAIQKWRFESGEKKQAKQTFLCKPKLIINDERLLRGDEVFLHEILFLLIVRTLIVQVIEWEGT